MTHVYNQMTDLDCSASSGIAIKLTQFQWRAARTSDCPRVNFNITEPPHYGLISKHGKVCPVLKCTSLGELASEKGRY